MLESRFIRMSAGVSSVSSSFLRSAFSSLIVCIKSVYGSIYYSEFLVGLIIVLE